MVTKIIDKIHMIHKFNKQQKTDPSLTKTKFCNQEKISYTTYLGWETNKNIIEIMKFTHTQIDEIMSDVHEILIERESELIVSKSVFTAVLELEQNTTGSVNSTETPEFYGSGAEPPCTIDQNKTMKHLESRLERQKRTITALKTSIKILKSRNRKQMKRQKNQNQIDLCSDPLSKIKLQTYSMENIQKSENLLKSGDHQKAANFLAYGLAYQPEQMYRFTLNSLAQSLPPNFIRIVEECGTVARQRAKRQQMEILTGKSARAAASGYIRKLDTKEIEDNKSRTEIIGNDGDAAPVEERVEEYAAPVVEESAAPVEKSAAPVEETPATVEEKVEETAASVEEMVESGQVEESAAPVVEGEKAAEPVVEEAKVEEAKVEETAAPVEEAKKEEEEEAMDTTEEVAAPVVEEEKAAEPVVEEKAAEPVDEEKKEKAAPVEKKKKEAVVEAENEEAKLGPEEPAKETTAEAPKTENKQSAAPAVEKEKAAEPFVEEKKEEAAPVEEKKEEASGGLQEVESLLTTFRMAVVEAENEEAKPATEEPAKETTAEAPKTDDIQSESQAAN